MRAYDRVRLWVGPPVRGRWEYGTVTGAGRDGVTINFDREVNGVTDCRATHDEVEKIECCANNHVVPGTHSSMGLNCDDIDDIQDHHDWDDASLPVCKRCGALSQAWEE